MEHRAVLSEIITHCIESMKEKLLQYYGNFERLDIPGGSLNPPMSKITQDFEYLFADMSFADVDLNVDGNVLKAHKVILSSKSENIDPENLLLHLKFKHTIFQVVQQFSEPCSSTTH